DEQLIDRSIPCRHRCSARVQVVPVAPAAGALDGHHVGGAFSTQQGWGRVGALRIHQDVALSAQYGQTCLEERHVLGVSDEAYAGPELSEGMAEHGGAGGAVSLRRVVGHRETGGDEYAPRSTKGLGGLLGAARN